MRKDGEIPMKKKIYAPLLIMMLLSLLLNSCGTDVKLNDNNARTAKSIVNIVDSYLDGEIDADEAHNKIEMEYDSIDENDENSVESALFSSNTLFITIELSSMAYDGNGDVSTIKDCRNEIAELIDVEKYK